MKEKAVTRKICFLIPSVDAGGIETYLLRFLRFLDGPYDITVLVRNNKEGELLEAYRSLDAELIFKPVGYINLPRIYDLYQFFKSRRFDVVCDFNANFGGVPMMVANLAAVPVRIAFYRQGRDHFKPSFIRNSVNKLMNRLVYRFATDILFNSESAREVFFDYRDPDDQRFRVIYNGVDSRFFEEVQSPEAVREMLHLPKGNFIIGHTGRLDPAKNHGTILRTAKRLKTENSNIHFVLCGSGTEGLSGEIKSMQLEDMFTILGYRSDIPQVLQSFDLFFFPSLTEGQPNALIEAMISGLPVVASNIAPIRECVPKELYSNLVPPEDDEAFSKRIQNFINDKNGKEFRLKEWAAKKFDSETNFNHFKTILDQ